MKKSSKRKSGKSRQKPKDSQRKYVKARIEGKDQSNAARAAGYAESTAKHGAALIENSKGVKELFTTLMDKAGISDRLLVKLLYQGLFAMETKTATLDGKITDKAHMVAFSERRGMLELVLKLKGHLIDKHELRMVRTMEDILEEVNG